MERNEAMERITDSWSGMWFELAMTLLDNMSDEELAKFAGDDEDEQ